MLDQLAQQEAAKYDTAWATEGYGNYSPGASWSDVFRSVTGAKRGAYVIDLGCGAGAATIKLHEMGFRVAGLDLVRDQFKHHGTLPFYHQTLWEPIPWVVNRKFQKQKWTYGFCCDVLEHIPPEKVDDVLSTIAAGCKYAYLAISHEHDRFGAKVGHTLHLTVRPFEWWIEKMKEHFSEIKDARDRIGNGLYFAKS